MALRRYVVDGFRSAGVLSVVSGKEKQLDGTGLTISLPMVVSSCLR